MGKLVITRQFNRVLSVLFDEKKPYLMETAALPEKEGLLGSIYLAKVKDISRYYRDDRDKCEKSHKVLVSLWRGRNT